MAQSQDKKQSRRIVLEQAQMLHLLDKDANILNRLLQIHSKNFKKKIMSKKPKESMKKVSHQ